MANKKPVVKPTADSKETRTKARKAKHVEQNQARHAKNLALLGVNYDDRGTRTKTKTTTRWTGGKLDTTTRTRQVSLSPSKQLRMERRLKAGITK